MRRCVMMCALLSAPFLANANNSVIGYISDVTFENDRVLIRTSAGVPTNCAGTPLGWMAVPSDNKPMHAFVLGLWLRGDLSQVQMTIYTHGILSGICTIGQIDPVE